MSGKVVNIFLKEKHQIPMREVGEVQADAGKGLVGDVSYGRAKRQVLFIEKETLDDFDLIPGQVKENVTVTGVALAGLPAGTRLQAGEALFEVTGDCAPCQLIEDIRPGLRADMTGRRGTLFLVLQGGAIRVEDSVEVVG